MSTRLLTGLVILLAPGILRTQSPAALRIGVDSLHATSHSFTYSQQIAIERVGDGFRYRDSHALRDLMAYTVTVELTKDLVITRVSRTGYALFGRSLAADVRYEGGRARGTALSAVTGDTVERVDAAVPPHAIDRLGLLPLLLASPWEVGASRPITLFDLDEATLSEHSWTVTGRETITVPAGTFATLRGELSHADLIVWVTEARPHRLIKLRATRTESVLVR